MQRPVTIALIACALTACAPALEGPGEPSSEELQKQADILNNQDSQPDKEYTYDQFLAIEIGSTLEEVQALLGQGESLNSWTQDEGFGEFDFTDYSFSSPTAQTVITIVLVDNKVVGKDQMGLGNPEEHRITPEQLQQIQEGQTLAEVEEIYGKSLGNLASVKQPNPKDDNPDTFFLGYQFFNSVDSPVGVFFQGGVVTGKGDYAP